MTDERRAVSISGSGRLSGGTYAGVTISGSGRIEGDLTADVFRISGSGKVEGDLEAKEVRVSGSGKVTGETNAGQITVSGSGTFGGNVDAEEIRSSGACRVEGYLHAKEIKSSGSFRVSESVTGDYVKVTGTLRVGGDVESEIFKSTGLFDIAGLLSADKVEVQLAGLCRAREIGGERIEVRGFTHRFQLLEDLTKALLGKRGGARLETSQIEGDEITLENTQADIVRGKHVEIGPGCRIGAVEYEDTLKVHKDARVETKTKL